MKITFVGTLQFRLFLSLIRPFFYHPAIFFRPYTYLISSPVTVYK